MRNGYQTPTMDKYNLHGVGGYCNDPATDRAIAALQARWDALSKKDRKKAQKEYDNSCEPDGPGR